VIHLRNHKEDKKAGYKYGPTSVAVAADNADANDNDPASKPTSPPEIKTNIADGIAAAGKQRTKRSLLICPLEGCKQHGHTTARSKKCKLNKDYVLLP